MYKENLKTILEKAIIKERISRKLNEASEIFGSFSEKEREELKLLEEFGFDFRDYEAIKKLLKYNERNE